MSFEEDSHQQSSFTTGFTLGLFAGAGGYFLFGTKRGAELRRQLVDEWEKAKDRMVAEGVIERSDLSLREFVSDWLHRFFAEETATPTSDENTRKALRSSTRHRDMTKRFRGV